MKRMRTALVFLVVGVQIIMLATWSFSAQSTRLSQFASMPDSISDIQLDALDKRYNSDRLQSFTKPLLVVRYVNSPGHESVRSYLNNFLKTRKWVVEEDVFQSTMPNGTTFRGANIIASSKTITRNTRRLILACHWDSKYIAGKSFIGATDSAIPCGMLLWLADAFQSVFADQSNADLLNQADVALQLVFFDGEEAIEEWTDTDSIYGSRNLAERWQRENKISSIDLFVLLDLLGAPNPRFYSFFDDTKLFFKSLGDAEGRLLRLWSSHGLQRSSVNNIFGAVMQAPGHISDDHLPFVSRGVPVLHVIPYPFPDVWHTIDDTVAHIDWPTVDRLTRVFSVFTLRHINGLILANNQGSNNILIVPDFA